MRPLRGLRRPLARSLIALALLAPGIPSPAAGEARALPDPRALVAAVREAVAAGGIAPVVEAGAAMQGVRVVPGIPAPAPVPTGAPDALARPVAMLLGALRDAGSAARSALRASPHEIEQEARRAARLMDLATSAPETPGLAARGALAAARAEAMVDRAVLYGGALDLASAIDRALPLLLAAAATLPAPPGRVAGCDLVDEAPHVCVAGTGDNVITEDHALVIDLGGNDVHRHSAGGASVQVNGLAAAVTLDLGGNDAYEARVGIDTASAGAQGAARTGGVGILVDADGDDSYSITADSPSATQILGHGAAVAGVGILADAGGDDDYAIVNTQASTATHAQGQGFTAIGAMGVFLDTGMGNDTITDEASPVPFVDAEGVARASRARAECCGSAAGGAVSVYVDDGGDDVSSVTAVSGADDPAAVPDQAVTSSHGLAGLGGVGVVLTGAGGSERTVSSFNTGARTGQATAVGFGDVALGGVTATVDAGGDDRYVAVAASEATDDLVLSDGCACERQVGAVAGNALVGGTGYGALGGTALFEDSGGNDVYDFDVRSSAAAALEDARTHQPGATVSLPRVRAEAGTAGIDALGFGAAAAHGAFTDAAGDDVYRPHATSEASAVSGPDAPGLVHRSEAVAGLAQVRAAGAGFGDLSGAAPGAGEFRDLGGADAYEIQAAAPATAEPAGSELEGLAVTSVLGSVEQNAVATFLDEGGADTISIVPPDPACEGQRGAGTWRDCGTLLGAGVNRP